MIWMLSGIRLVCLLWLELPPQTVKLGMLFSNWQEENFLWGLSVELCKSWSVQGERPSAESLWKAGLLLKNKTAFSLAAPRFPMCGFPWSLAFVADGLVSTGAFVKETLNILMISVSVVHPFLKDVSHAQLYLRNDVAFVSHWKTRTDAWGVSLWLVCLHSSPSNE